MQRAGTELSLLVLAHHISGKGGKSSPDIVFRTGTVCTFVQMRAVWISLRDKRQEWRQTGLSTESVCT